MTYEIIGSRILSPFLGTSTYIWTSLIGVILGSLSLGYWLGGRAADRRPETKYLAGVVLLASGLISLTALIKEVLLSKIAGIPTGLEAKALIASVILFAPASICLGVVTPFAVRIRMTNVETTGRTVGRLYALSTIGSIVGTFAAGFFLIPFVGSVRTLYLIAAILFIIAIVLVPFSLSRTTIAAVILLLLGIASTEIHSRILGAQNGLYDVDTEYSRVQVFSTKDPTTGKEIRALATDPYFVQSAIFFDSNELVLPYAHFYHLIRHFRPDFSRTLIIGGAGYTFPREYLRSYPTAVIDVVEIDPKMTEIARRLFRLQDDLRMNIFHEDGRMFINRAKTGEYDAILMDAFGSMFSVPTHMTTKEAVHQLHRILNDEGVVIFNLGSGILGPGSRFLNAELATYKQAFPSVYLFKVNNGYPDEKLQNLIIVASKSMRALDLGSKESPMAELLKNLYTTEIGAFEPVLTDDLAPVEYYNSIAQNLYLPNR